MGKVLETKTTHSDGTKPLPWPKTIPFMQEGLKVDHQVNGQAQVIDAEWIQWAGRIDRQKLHSTDGSNFEQSVDYAYNIRGWLNSINDAALSDGENDYFGMEMGYNTELTGVSNAIQFNGNISGMKWSNYFNGDGKDKPTAMMVWIDWWMQILSKKSLIGSTLINLMYTWPTTLMAIFSRLEESHLTTGAIMDDLVYDYSGLGNQLLSVTDNGNIESGFIDNNTSGNDYAYDDNGNMTMDYNKDITGISYSTWIYQTVTFAGGRSIIYTYDAAGIKLAKAANDNGNITTTDYVVALYIRIMS